MRLILVSALGAFVLLLASAVMPVRPAAAATCSVTGGTLAFGAVDTLAASPTSADGDLSISCSDASAASVRVCVGLGAGTGGSDAGYRLLSNGDTTLSYGLYADSGLTTGWGANDAAGLGEPQGVTLATSDGSASAEMTVYGRVPGSQTSASTGAYSSLVTVTLAYAEGSDLDCASPASASTATGSLTVSANVAANCLVVAQDLDFGTAGLIDADISAEADLDVTCTPGASYAIAMGAGLYSDGSTRRMRSTAGDYVSYGLYNDSGGAVAWGDGTSSDTLGGTGVGEETVPVYGIVPPQSAAPGNYSDTVVVTITYQ
ncbi:Csu type fimbrial protein [Jiella mangrovi]|uniref:Spore coat U domain-containing protein n=1 Tax=Jiella mangrovi TaxID=2821407 RepID=A0ABS4BGL5_9HYPH|nr:spore coat U domain-containing protein [Jiella mangrovi]MBP0615841.1 spore coat U domain-containing protein [Jiella mangrovi]